MVRKRFASPHFITRARGASLTSNARTQRQAGGGEDVREGGRREGLTLLDVLGVLRVEGDPNAVCLPWSLLYFLLGVHFDPSRLSR
jgi:hypothetical protein